MNANPSLTLVRRFDAPPAKVFAAWTEPGLLAQWFGPHGTSVAEAEVEPRVDGGFRVVIVEDTDVRAGAGSRHQANGIYRAIEAPHRLVFDWFWSATPELVSRVTVTLRALDGGTELTLLHERFTDAVSATRHRRGWTESLARLAALTAPA